MNSEQRLICQLVGASVLGTEMPAVDNPNWENIHNEFVAQAIIALPAQILNQLPMSKELMNRWQLELMTTSAHAIQLISAQNELVQLLGKHAIPYVILKGVAVAKYYPLPWLRTMGDVDFIVLPKDYDRTKQLLLSNGFAQTEHDNPRHEAFELRNTHYELHHHFTADPDDKKIIDELIYEQLDNAVEAKVMNYLFNALPETMNGIILIQHIKHHLRTGLGLRQMIDWFMYVHAQLNDENWPAFKVVADKTGLTTLAKVATRIGQLYFGLDENINWCKDADKVVCEDIMDFIFSSGNLG